MFIPYPKLTALGKDWGKSSDYCKCHGQRGKPCPHDNYAVFRVSTGNRTYHDLCRSCERKVRRRYLRLRNKFYMSAMSGEIHTPLADGGTLIIL